MREEELKEIFLAEALNAYEELNKHFIQLEKDHNSKKSIEAIFRITHTLKANAAGMGFNDMASLAHTLEDVFACIKNNQLELETSLFNDLYKSNDLLGLMLQRLKTNSDEAVKFKGVKAKLDVVVRKVKHGENSLPTFDDQPKIVSTSAIEDSTVFKREEQHHPEIFTSNLQSSKNQLDENELIEHNITFSDLVQIPVRKLDQLMNLVGELIIERDRILTVSTENGNSTKEYSRLQRITSDLQYSVMDVRLIQIGVLLNKFSRIIRDTAIQEEKEVDLVLQGTEIEIDRNVLQNISESMVHLVRNAIGHGIEKPEERLTSGKPKKGKLSISASSQKDTVIIEVSDDGRGIDVAKIKKKLLEKKMLTKEHLDILSDDDIIQYIFAPGFSSADQVSSLSGRGVGMDVVKKSIEGIGGKIEFETQLGKGTTFRLFLPSSMALKSVLLFELNQNEFAIPLAYTESVILIKPEHCHKVSNQLVYNHLGSTVHLLNLREFLGFEKKSKIENTDSFLPTIIVSMGGKKTGLIVDKLLQQKEIVEKKLDKPLNNSSFISGATILGKGNVCLVLDVPSVLKN
ncbi:MAG: chemotaxis protein CheA [Cytophagales bacterium]